MHYKKSEIQIGKESRGVSSDYNRNPQTHSHYNNSNQALLLQDESKAHKRPLQPPKNNPRKPCSISRSPTIKDSIQTFSCLKDSNSVAVWRHGIHRSLIPPLVIVVAVPCIWWYFRAISNSDSESNLDSSINQTLLGIWFDFLAAVVFFTGVVVCVRIAFPGFAGLLLSASLAALAEKKRKAAKVPKILQSPVTWTIGSKSKVEGAIKFSSENGVLVFNNGDVYEGEFHKGKSSGSGVYYYYESGRYEGDWVDGKYDGYGIETWAKGSRYRGQYRQGLRHGYGIYRFYTGDVYAGEWFNGQSHGYGVHTCEDGSRYVGEFKWGVKHGLGYYHFRNGDTYAGEYFADRMHGFGVYSFANGHCFEGSWHEGAKQGLGMYTFRRGEYHCGKWNHGVLEIPSTYTTQLGSPIAVNHSKILNAVQEARHAAEKAFRIPRVDEKVERAVSAANRSANAARIAAVKAVQRRMHADLLDHV